MTGEHAKGEVLSVASPARTSTGHRAKMLHLAPIRRATSCQVGGSRRRPHVLPRLVQVNKVRTVTLQREMYALLVDTISRSDTYPYVDIRETTSTMGHEATVSKVSADQLFYLMSRGMTEDEAMAWWCVASSSRSPRNCHGVRAGTEPADRATDGGLGRMTSPPTTPLSTRESCSLPLTSTPSSSAWPRRDLGGFTPAAAVARLHDGSRVPPAIEITVSEQPAYGWRSCAAATSGWSMVFGDRVAAQAFSSFNSATLSRWARHPDG